MPYCMLRILQCSNPSLRGLRFSSFFPVLHQRPSMSSLDNEFHRAKVAVRNIPANDFIDLSIRFGGTASALSMKPRIFNFHRLKEEAVGRTLERMSQNLTARITARQSKKLKKSASPEPEKTEQSIPLSAPVQVALTVNESVVSPEIPNVLAWVKGSELRIDENTYVVVVNPPNIAAGKITGHILPDFPIDVSLDFEFANEEDAVFVWMKHIVGTRSPPVVITEDIQNASTELPLSLLTIQEVINDRMKPAGMWRIASLERDWKPTKDDVGAVIGLICFPIREGEIGEPFVTVAKNLVADGLPASVPYRSRHDLCRTRCGPGSFRVISYNLLADIYGAMESTLKDLFPYCPPEYMKIDYRRQLAMQEMLGYNADVLCLQEVDTKHFENSFLKPFRRKGYNGVVLRKKGTVAEGVATFYRTDKFSLLRQHDVNLTEALFENPIFSSIAEAVNAKAKLKETLLDRGTPVQVSVLQSRENLSRILVVANTHLWFRPQFPHVRLLQMAVILGHLEEVIEITKKERKLDRDPAVMICGDFNSTAGWGVHRLLNTGEIPAGFTEWNQFCKEEDEFIQVALKHPFKLYSACGQLPYTNFVPNFKAAIDWIYADSSALETVSVIPVPSEEELSAHVAIPSIVFPSDHIAIGCDLKWKA